MKIIFYILFISSIFPFKDKINAGPMVGYSTKREVALWIQTKAEFDVKFLYWDKNNPNIILRQKITKQVGILVLQQL